MICVMAYSGTVKCCLQYCQENVSVHVACTGTARLEPRIPLMTLWWDEFVVMDVCDHGVVFADVIVGSKHP